MKHFSYLLLSLFLSLNLIQAQDSHYKFVGYYPNWYIYPKPGSESFKPNDIKAHMLTHINYAFAKPYTTNNATERKVISYETSLTDPWADIDYDKPWDSKDPNAYFGNFGQLRELKTKNPHLKTLLSIGGWSIWQEGMPKEKFAILAADPKLRKEFIDSAIKLCAKYDFDGLDIDWEYPGKTDKDNFILLIKELSAATKNSAKLATIYREEGKTPKSTLLLTIAAPAGPVNIENMSIDKIYPYLDWINLMTYDYNGSWDTITNHNAPLHAPAQGNKDFDIESTVRIYKGLGVPSDKLVLGMALYGRSFAGVQPNNEGGLFSTFKGPGLATFSEELGMILYHTIKNKYLPPAPESAGFKRYWDNKAKVPYLFNAQTGDFISYDDPESFELKAKFLKEQGLGGAMFWVLAKEEPQWQLINVVRKTLGLPQ